MDGPPPLNVARWLARSRVNGPGERFVLWLQGCSLRCPGCWNPDTWSATPRRLMSAAEVLAEILATPGIEGVSLSGGEPFDQAAALVPLLEGVRREGLSSLVFTGYELRELTSDDARRALALADVVVTGRYVASLRSLALPLVGSSNQRVHFLSPRYRERDLRADDLAEIHVDTDGTLHITGFPPADFLRG